MSGVTNRLFCSQLKNCLSRLNSFFVLICGFRHGIKPCYLLTFHSMLFCKTFDCFVIAIQRTCFPVVSQVALESCIDNRYRTCNKWCTKARLLPRSACWTTSFRGLAGCASPPRGWRSWQNKLGTILQQIVLTLHLTQCSCFSVMICRYRNRRSATLQSHRRSCKAFFHCSSHMHT